jgi:hypothetical protein
MPEYWFGRRPAVGVARALGVDVASLFGVVRELAFSGKKAVIFSGFFFPPSERPFRGTAIASPQPPQPCICCIGDQAGSQLSVGAQQSAAYLGIAALIGVSTPSSQLSHTGAHC